MSRLTKSVIGAIESAVITNRKRSESTIIIVLLFLIFKDSSAHDLNDYPDVVTQEPEVRSDPAGSLIKLKCALNPCPQEQYLIRWEFQVCGSDLPNKPKCHNNYNSENNRWTRVSEKNKFSQCNSVYTLKNATVNNTGLYRCVKYSSNSEQMTVVKVYQLNIIERIDIKKGIKPKLLDVLPMNTTIMEHTKIVIQCKVYSEFVLPPDIWWLKQLEEPSTSSSSTNTVFPILYNNKTYLNMKTSQKELGNHTYISKLIIERPNDKDSGIYTCLAVNLFGTSEQDVFVDVIASEKDWQGQTSFLILFLIPIGFALVPASVWLCVYFYRKKKLRKISMQNNIRSETNHNYEPVMMNRHYYNRQYPNTRIV